MYNYNTSSKFNCQPFNFKNPQPHAISPIGEIHAMSPYKLKVLNSVIWFAEEYRLAYPTQTTLAIRSRMSRKTVNKYVKYLVERGYIAVNWNGHNKSLWYKISNIFRNDDFRKAVQEKLTSLKLHFGITALASTFKSGLHDVFNVFNFINTTTTNHNNSLKKSSYFREELRSKESMILKKMIAELKLGNYEVTQLENFDDKILTKAYVAYRAKKDVKSPFKFILQICKNIKEAAVVREELAQMKKEEVVASQKKVVVQEKKYTVFDIANELAKLNVMKDMFGGESYKQRALHNWCITKFELNGEPNEWLAIECINKYRKMFNEELIKYTINEQELILSKDNDSINVFTHDNENDSSIVKFDNINPFDFDEDYEEVFDGMV